MTHEIEGFILLATHPARQLDGLQSVVRRPLRLGMVFVPLGDALIGEIGRNVPSDAANPHAEFRGMSAALAKLLSELSADGPVAYVETEYWGGAGDQAAAVWDHRRLALPPKRAEFGPINLALGALGVDARGYRDAFEAVGLNTHRLTRDWEDDGL